MMMKIKSYLFVFVLLFVNIMLQNAQSVIGFPTKDASWQEGYYLSASQVIPQRRVLCGDTTINSKTYAKLFTIIFNNQGTESGRNYEGVIRSTTDFVFWIPKNELVESILYDWSLESTQTITLQTITGSQNILTAKSNQYLTTSDGVFRRVIVFKSQAGAQEEVWIEGIGSSSGIIARGVNPNESSDYVPFLNCYRFESEVIYTPPNPPLACDYIFNENCLSTSIDEYLDLDQVHFSIFPNPFLDKIELEVDGFELLGNPSWKMYNLHGQQVVTGYLQGAKEVILLEGKMGKGIYLLEISDDSKKVIFRQKIVKGE
jgi:hypothetical protein